MVEYPSNELTKAIEALGELNRSGMARGGVASATPLPTVRSAAFGEVAEEPLTPEQIAELDLLAAQAGVKDERLGTTTETTQGAYKNMDEALAAGAPIIRPSVPSPAALRQTAREYIADMKRMPDFNKVQGFDLLANVVLIDGVTFPLDEETARDLRLQALEIVRQTLTEQMANAMKELTARTLAEVPNGGNAAGAVPEVQPDTQGGSAEPA